MSSRHLVVLQFCSGVRSDVCIADSTVGTSVPVMEYTPSIVLEITSTSFYRNADPCFSSLLQCRIMYLLFVFMLAAVLNFLIQLTLIHKLSYKNFSETEFYFHR